MKHHFTNSPRLLHPLQLLLQQPLQSQHLVHVSALPPSPPTTKATTIQSTTLSTTSQHSLQEPQQHSLRLSQPDIPDFIWDLSSDIQELNSDPSESHRTASPSSPVSEDDMVIDFSHSYDCLYKYGMCTCSG